MWKKAEDENLEPESPPFGKSTRALLKKPAAIGPSIRIKGTLAGKEDLIIEGRVEGKINLKKYNITVGKSGRTKGDIYGKIISIEGEAQGKLFGEEKIVVRQSGVVRGDMWAPRVTIEDGARFKGDIDMDSESGEKQTLKEVKVISSKASSPQNKAPKKAAATDASEPNGSGSSSELASKEKLPQIRKSERHIKPLTTSKLP